MKEIKVAAVSTRNWIGQPRRSIANLARWANRAAKEGAELVVFPELGVSGYIRDTAAWELAEPVPGPSTQAVAELAGDLGLTICFGLLERDADIVYNTQVLVNRAGMIGKQRKIHMPGEEYLYWRGGFEARTFNIGKARVGITICYDSLFPELARTLFHKGAEILIMPFAYKTGARANFPENDITAMCYRTQCYHNGCFGILCNNAGKKRFPDGNVKKHNYPGWAGVFDPEGAVVAFTREPGYGEAMSVAVLDPSILAARRSSPYFTPRCLRPEIYEGIRGHEQP